MFEIAYANLQRVQRSRNPRKLFLGLPQDRVLAYSLIREARTLCRGARLPGYDTHLRVAAVLAERALASSERPSQLEHVRDALARAALD